MAILYRAMWSDSGADLVERVRTAFAGWIAQKTNGRLDATVAGYSKTDDGIMEIRVEYVQSEMGNTSIAKVFRAALIEESLNGRRWTTTVRSWAMATPAPDASAAAQWVWVDVEAVTDDSTEMLSADAPRFVRELLTNGSSPNRMGTPLAAEPHIFEGEGGAEAVAALITNVERDVPIVVFAPIASSFQFRRLPHNVTLAEWFDLIVTRAASMTAGLVLVCQLDANAEQPFASAIGSDYAVRDGAFRIYLPGLDPALDEAWKHRYTVPVRFLERREAAGQFINRAITLRASAKRAPASYEAGARLLESARSKEPEELRMLLDMAMDEATEYRSRLASLDQNYIESVEEQQNLTEENNRLRADLSRVFKQLALRGEDISWQPEANSSDEPPDTAESPSDAALLAQFYLGNYLSLPDEACVDLADLDSAVEVHAWGNTSWRAFRALHAYGEAINGATDPGNFWIWCENSGDPHIWPATSKKLAMVESSRVRNDDKLWKKRIFPVDREVDPSGTMYMEAHIKIAEGGGLRAPRIYFYVDRRLGKVHVGYFGPHRNVPNTVA
jgi:hypothetical protein